MYYNTWVFLISTNPEQSSSCSEWFTVVIIVTRFGSKIVQSLIAELLACVLTWFPTGTFTKSTCWVFTSFCRIGHCWKSWQSNSSSSTPKGLNNTDWPTRGPNWVKVLWTQIYGLLLREASSGIVSWSNQWGLSYIFTSGSFPFLYLYEWWAFNLSL